MMDKVNAVNACKNCSDNTVLEVKNVINCGPNGCTYQENDPNGIGFGVNYNTQ